MDKALHLDQFRSTCAGCGASNYCYGCYTLSKENAELQQQLDAIKADVKRLMAHRDVPCDESEICKGVDGCGVVSHNHLVCKTKEARDDLATLSKWVDGGEG